MHTKPMSSASLRQPKANATLPPLIDLLGRKELDVDLTGGAALIRGRRVLVTGAGGSIGTQLCLRLSALGPSELLLLDRDESSLEAAKGAVQGSPEGALSLILADIRDRTRIETILRQCEPEIIFHAAALKHVPLLEKHPHEALQTNVFGTIHVLDAAAKNGVSAVVNISTDKAADPVNVLGYSKYVGERLTAWFAERFLKTCFVSIRLGNVLTSRGSMLDVFLRQLSSGQPLTITDLRASRFLLTPTEAANLIINTCTVGESGHTIVPHLDKPVCLKEIVECIIRHNAGTNLVKVSEIGLRPGEKLHEVLVGEHESVEIEHHKFFSRVRPTPLSAQTIKNAYMGTAYDTIDVGWLARLVSLP